MLLQREIKAYIKANYITSIMKQLPEQYQTSSGIISLSLKLDLTKTLRQNNQIGLFIIGDYPRFIKLVQQSILQGVIQTKKFTPQYGFNISFSISNCPLPRHNLESVDFLSAAFEQQQGVLVYLKDAHILKVNQPQLYLSSWQEVWAGFCSCNTERQLMKKQQSLIEIVKSKSQNIREALILQTPRCSQCNSKLRLMGIQDKYFLNCQLIKIMANMKDNITNSKDQIFQRGQFSILVDENNAQQFQEGDIADMCCYYSAQPRISKINGLQMNIKCQSGLFLICSYPVNSLTSNNNIFFSSLIGLNCQYIKCDDPTDEETICYNYKNLIKTINSIKFPYLTDNSLSTLKLIVVNSLFNLAQQIKIHFIIITDEVNLIKQSLKVNGVVIRHWPSLYDHNTLIQFLNTCHNCILMFTNPSKKDFQYINNILNEKIMNSINFTLWVVTEPNPQLKKDVIIDRFQIVIDLSIQKNITICKSVYDSMIDQKLQSFLERTNEIMLTVPKGKRKVHDQQDFIGQSFQGVQCDQQQMQNESKIALKLLERYFVRARQYKTISSSSLENIKHIAEGFAHFRAFLRSKGSQKVKKSPINILDAIISIFIEEQTSRNKYSSSNTLFSNEISKLMLNEGDCELSFWDYQVDEDNDHLNESKKMIKKDDMFKRMVNKLMTLIYNNEAL